MYVYTHNTHTHIYIYIYLYIYIYIYSTNCNTISKKIPQIQSDQLSLAISKNPSVVNTIKQIIINLPCCKG